MSGVHVPIVVVFSLERKWKKKLRKRDSMIIEMRRLQGQGLKSYKCQCYSWNLMANNVILLLTVSLWSRGESKGNVFLSSFKNNKTTFLLPWCLSHSVSTLCRNDPEVPRNTCFLIAWLKNAAWCIYIREREGMKVQLSFGVLIRQVISHCFQWRGAWLQTTENWHIYMSVSALLLLIKMKTVFSSIICADIPSVFK